MPGTGTGAPGRRSPAYTPHGRTVGARQPNGLVIRAAPAGHAPRGGAVPAGPQAPGLRDRPARLPAGPRRPAGGHARRPRGQPGAVRRGRQRLDGGAAADARRQGRGALAAARRLPAPGQGWPDHLPRHGRRTRAAAHLLGGGGRPRLAMLATGGRTSLAAGVARAAGVCRREDPRPRPPPAAGDRHRGRATSGGTPSWPGPWPRWPVSRPWWWTARRSRPAGRPASPPAPGGALSPWRTCPRRAPGRSPGSRAPSAGGPPGARGAAAARPDDGLTTARGAARRCRRAHRNRQGDSTAAFAPLRAWNQGGRSGRPVRESPSGGGRGARAADTRRQRPGRRRYLAQTA